MFSNVKLCVELFTLWMVSNSRPATANIGPHWVAMRKDAATIIAEPVQAITPIMRWTPEPTQVRLWLDRPRDLVAPAIGE